MSDKQSPVSSFARAATRAINRAEVIDHNFIQFVRSWPEQAPRADLNAPLRQGSPLTGRDFLELFESQMLSRQQDIEARAMRARNEGFYT
ncbi:MAG: MFS transporter, partial [Candidatus Dormibacteria bacterium]